MFKGQATFSANARLILMLDKVLVRDTYSTASERVCRLSEYTSGRFFQLKKTESIKMWAAFGSHTFLYSPEVKSLFLLAAKICCVSRVVWTRMAR